MIEKLIKYCSKKNFEVKNSMGNEILIFAKWENKKLMEKYLKRLKINYLSWSASNYEYIVYSIKNDRWFTKVNKNAII